MFSNCIRKITRWQLHTSTKSGIFNWYIRFRPDIAMQYIAISRKYSPQMPNRKMGSQSRCWCVWGLYYTRCGWVNQLELGDKTFLYINLSWHINYTSFMCRYLLNYILLRYIIKCPHFSIGTKLIENHLQVKYHHHFMYPQLVTNICSRWKLH